MEIHTAHGVIHQFVAIVRMCELMLTEGVWKQIRLTLIVEVVTARMAIKLPLFVRISATDWADGGWNAEESVQL
jgi:hypothetical protein